MADEEVAHRDIEVTLSLASASVSYMLGVIDGGDEHTFNASNVEYNIVRDWRG